MGIVMTAHTNRYIYKNGAALIDELGSDNENHICPLKSLLKCWSAHRAIYRQCSNHIVVSGLASRVPEKPLH